MVATTAVAHFEKCTTNYRPNIEVARVHNARARCNGLSPRRAMEALMRATVMSVAVLAVLIVAPSSALAQAVIAGVVTDASGAVLPGVTVEATSPALIEKLRSVVTDGAGQYRIEDLRPGTYAVVFSLTGFSQVRREGVELTGSFTATIDANLRVGSLEETITVTAESP